MIKYIFSINTGRSGSNYLANILEEFEDISSFHEPNPILNGKYMVEFLKGNYTLMKEEARKKVDKINLAIIDNKCYVETNHCFIKGFGWFIPSLIPHEQIGIIFLKRDKDEIIKSLYRINCTPLTYNGLTWIMNPLMKDPVNPVPFYDKIKYRLYFFGLKLIRSKYAPDKIKRHKKLKLIKKFEFKYLDWYVKETYGQAEKFRNKFPNIRFYETTINKLNEIKEFEKMFSFFDLPFHPKDAFYDKLGQKINRKHAES